MFNQLLFYPLFTLVLLLVPFVRLETPIYCSEDIIGPREANGCLILMNECLYVYMEGIEIDWKIGDAQEIETISLRDNKPTGEGTCNRPTTKNPGYAMSSNLQIKFASGLSNASQIVFSLIVNVDQEKKYWVLENSTLSITQKNSAEKEFKLSTSGITAPSTFSYHCSQAKLPNMRYFDDKGDDHVNMMIKRFQIQPFVSKNPSNFFTDAYDCAQWFTIATWMGFLVLLLFTVIVATGIYFLSQIRTMDRFESPKAKPISVPTTE